MPLSPSYQPTPIFLELGDGFSDVVEAARFPEAKLRFRNQAWSERMGLGELTAAEWEAHFARFEPLSGNLPKPLALRYHGHQFRSYNPDLGDGRGFLFAQMRDPQTGRVLDLGTKGSGQTPYSRGGDGRLTLKGGVREALATEMLESLGVATSKTFSLFETGEALQRGDEPSPTRSSVLVRLGHSHIRYGTFQRLAVLGEAERMRRLIDYCGRHYFPELLTLQEADRPAALLGISVARAAELAASWMIAGFVHGVLNTDNMIVTGESMDYGPFRFLPKYDPNFTAAYFDHTGLYAYGRQPESVLWNLEQLASALLLLGPEKASLIAALDGFAARFNAAVSARFLDRMGLAPRGAEEDETLFMAAFHFLDTSQITFAQFFHDWFAGDRQRAQRSPDAESYQGEHFEVFIRALDGYKAVAPERLQDPYFTRPRPCDLLIDEVEAIWEPIARDGTRGDDWSLFEAKIADIRTMGRAYGRRKPGDV